MKSNILKLFMVVLSLLFAIPNNFIYAQIDTQRVISVGQNAIYFKDYLLAIQYFNSAIQSAPYLAEPYYYRGMAKYNLDDYLGAEDDTNEAIKRNPFIYGAYYLRAISRHTLGRDSLALEDYKVVLHDNPDHQGALHNSALLLIALRDSLGARETLDHLQRYYPKYAQGYLIDGGLQLDRGDTTAALSLFEKALKLSPNLPGAYLSMASISYDRKDYATAESYMDKAIEQMPDQVELYVNRGIIRYQQYNFKGSMADYNTAVQLDPSNSLALYNRALLRNQVGEINGAQEDFDKVATLEPNNFFALFNRAILSNEVGDYRQAESDLDRIVERYPTFLPALIQRAEARRGQGRIKESKEDLYLASKMTYDRSTLEKATAKQEEQNSLASNADRVREEKDENIQKFRSLVYASQARAYDELYQEEEDGIRGRIQDRDVLIEPEPLFTLSYYDDVEIQTKGNTNVYYSEALNLPLDEYGILVVQRVPQLPEKELNKYLERVDQFDNDTFQSVDALLRYAVDLLTLKDHDSAIKTLSVIINALPDDPAPYFQRATSSVLAFEAKQANEAQIEESNALGLPLVNGDISKSFLQKKHVAEVATKDLLKVLELVPHFTPALFNLGFISASIGNYSDAIKFYTEAINLTPNLGASYFNRGLCYYAIGEKEKADRDMSKAGALGFYKAYSIIKRMK